jgi:hypothetical protein
MPCVIVPLGPDHGLRVELGAVLPVENPDHFGGGHAAQFIIIGLLQHERGPMDPQGMGPCAVMEWHGINEGAVAVEQIS